MKIKIDSPIGIYELGRRAKQEDAMCPQLNELNDSNRVIVVCDGLGGHEHGDVASATVAHAIHEHITAAMNDGAIRGIDVVNAVKHAYNKLNETSARFGATTKPMGTTMTLLAIGNNGVAAAHIGDSRIYHVRPGEGILYRSRDHSLVNDLFVAGRLTRAEAEASPKKSILTRAMLPSPFKPMNADIAFITNVKAGDYFILCTDGVCGEISDKKLLKILNDNAKGNAEKMAAIQLLIQNGADNRTAVLLRVKSVEHEPDEVLLNANERNMCDRMVHVATTSVAATVANTQPAAPVVEQPQVENAEVPPIPTKENEPLANAIDQQEENINNIPPVPTQENVATDIGNATVTAKKDSFKRALWLALAALLLVGGILSFVLLKKPSTAVVEKPAADSLPDPDVTIDTILPEVPVDTFDIGSNVPVTPAPVPSISEANFPTGSNVSVPKAPRYNGEKAPYDPYEGVDNFGSDEPYRDVEPIKEAAPAPTPQQQQQPTASTPPPPPARKNNQQIGASNRGTAVPPPPSKRQSQPIYTP